MKTLTLIVILIVLAISVNAQYVNNNGTIEKTKTVTTTKPDSILCIKDGITFYKGTKGGIYYWKVSNTTGKKYKCYITNKK